MRAGKQSDSPSGYSRDVYPSRKPRVVREWPTGPVGDALHVVSVQWTAMHATGGQCPSTWETERLASRIYTLAHAASFEGFEHRAEMFAEIAVLALAGVARADAAALADPASGSAAA